MKSMTGLYQRGRVWWYRYSINGERVFHNTHETDYEKARVEAERIQQIKFEAKLNATELLPSGKYRLSDTIAAYRQELRRKSKRRRSDGRDSRYIESAISNLERFDREINVQFMSEITTKRLQDWVDFKERIDKIKPVTMEEYIGEVRRLFDFARTKYPLLRLPDLSVRSTEVHWQKPGKGGDARLVWVRPDDATRLINECGDTELKYILYCGFHAGLRFEEVVMSSPRWFDLNSRLIHVQPDPISGWKAKDDDTRWISISTPFLEFLRTEYAHRMKGAYMIAPEKLVQGKWRYRFTFANRFKRYMSKKGFGHIQFHDLRRSFGGRLASEGVPIAYIAQFLGDDEETAKKHYGHYQPRFHEFIDAGFNNQTPSKVVPIPISNAS